MILYRNGNNFTTVIEKWNKQNDFIKAAYGFGLLNSSKHRTHNIIKYEAHRLYVGELFWKAYI